VKSRRVVRRKDLKIKMSDSELRNVLIEAVKFLTEYCWLFNFANIKIFQVLESWPKNWTDFLKTIQSPDELKDVFSGKAGSKTVPAFVENFVCRRNVILSKLIGAIFTDEEEMTDVEACVISENLKRGMNPKKQLEVVQGPRL
jgi:hypothetical protein